MTDERAEAAADDGEMIGPDGRDADPSTDPAGGVLDAGTAEDAPGAAHVAFAYPPTLRAYRHRRRSVLLMTALGFIIIFGSGRWASSQAPGGLLGVLLGLMMLAGLALLVVALVQYGNLIRIEWILRRNPWVQWQSSTATARVGPFLVAPTVVLEHEEWDGPVVRSIRPRRYFSVIDGDDVVWAAGDPTGSMVVTSEGGEAPMYVRRYVLRSVKRRMQARAAVPAS